MTRLDDGFGMFWGLGSRTFGFRLAKWLALGWGFGMLWA